MLRAKGMTVSICTLPMRPLKNISSRTSAWMDRRGESLSNSLENLESSSGFLCLQYALSSDTAWSLILSKYSQFPDIWSEKSNLKITHYEVKRYVPDPKMAITFIRANSLSSISSLARAVVYSLILQTVWVTWRTLVSATLSRSATSLNWAAMAVRIDERCIASRHWARPRTNKSGQLFCSSFVWLEVLKEYH